MEAMELQPSSKLNTGIDCQIGVHAFISFGMGMMLEETCSIMKFNGYKLPVPSDVVTVLP